MAASMGKKRAKTGSNMVPSPNPENNVNALVKKEAMITMTNSTGIVLSGFNGFLLFISATGYRITGRF